MNTHKCNGGSVKGLSSFLGLRIIELGNFITAPYCSKLFADLGAEVIKVEKPGTGDEARSNGPFPGDKPHPEKSGLFIYLNGNKMGITLNLETATGKDIFRRLICESDILIENNPPGFLEGLGLSYETLSRLNPKMIVISITPFGQSGPYKDYKAYSINCAAGGGESNCIGEPSREPLAPPLSLGGYQAGVMAAGASMVALFAREKEGKGQHVDISEAEVWAKMHTSLMVHNFVFGGKKRTRTGHRTLGFYPYTVLPCKDGYVSLIAVLGTQWKKFLEIVGGGRIPDWYANEPKFSDRWVNSLKYADELDGFLKPWLMSHTREEIFSQCQEKRIPFAPVRTVDEVVNSNDLKERNFFVETKHPCAGKTKYPGPPFKLSSMPLKLSGHAPLLGQHNEKIYCGRLGYSKHHLVKLRRTGVI